jgi:hypothetical protein
VAFASAMQKDSLITLFFTAAIDGLRMWVLVALPLPPCAVLKLQLTVSVPQRP